MSHIYKLAVVALLCALLAPGAVAQTASVRSASDGLRLNFQGVPLDTVLDYLSESAGLIIIKDGDIPQSRVDVISHQPLSRDEAVELLDTVLRTKGLAAIRMNPRTLLIVDEDKASKMIDKVQQGPNPELIPRNEEMVNHIIPVRYANALQLISNLEPLLPEYAVMTANESSNAIVLTARQSDVRRMVEIVRALDTSISSISAVRVFQMQYADAKEVATMVAEVFKIETSSNNRGGGGGPGGGRMERFFQRMGGGDQAGTGTSEARQAFSRVVAVADERTNSLVVSAPDELMPTITDLVREIDTVTEDLTEIRVFPLRFASAEDTAQTITNVFSDTSSQQNQMQRTPRFFGGGRFGRWGGGGGGGGGGAQAQNGSERKMQQSKVVAVADTRTTSVVVNAASEWMEQIAGMVQQLDADPAGAPTMSVYPVTHGDPEAIADLLRGMYSGSTTTGAGNRNAGNRNNNNRNAGNQTRGGGGGGGGGGQGQR